MADDEINWRDLPQRLIPHIFKHIAHFDDYLRAHFACKKWGLADSLSESVLRPQPPLLMLPSRLENANAPHPFVDIPSRHALLIPFKVPHPNAHCVSTSHGWLFFLDSSPSLSLYNPITRRIFRLPSLDTLPDTILRYQPKINAEYVVRSDYPAEEEVELPCKGLIRFAILSADPVADPKFEAFLLLHRVHKLVFRFQNRPGETAMNNLLWTPVEINVPNPPFLVRDIIYARGLRRAFAVGASNKSLLVLSFPDGSTNADASVIETPDLPDSTDSYLALTPKDGNLMLVTRHERLDAIGTGIRHFRVFLLKGEAQEALMTVKEAVNMAEFAVFVGPGSSVCVDTTVFPEYKANAVYFTHEYYKIVTRYHVVGETVSRYDLRLRRVDETCDLDARGPPISLLFRSLGPAMWFTPSVRATGTPQFLKPRRSNDQHKAKSSNGECAVFDFATADGSDGFFTKMPNLPVSGSPFLVESAGNVWLVTVRRTKPAEEGQVEIYRLDLSRLPDKVTAVPESGDLGGRILFLEQCNSMSVSSTHFPGFEGDSIYFTEFNWHSLKYWRDSYTATIWECQLIKNFIVHQRSVKGECRVFSPLPKLWWTPPNLQKKLGE